MKSKSKKKQKILDPKKIFDALEGKICCTFDSKIPIVLLIDLSKFTNVEIINFLIFPIDASGLVNIISDAKVSFLE